MINLSALPAPTAIAELSFETIRQDMIAVFLQECAAHGIVYGVSTLEANPIGMIIRSEAYRELILRADINSALKTRLIAFATGGDLDHLAAFYDVIRLANEADDRLRERIMLAISGRSTAGPREWYIAAAMRSDPRVKAASIFRDRYLPNLTISILATDNGGIPDAALLAAVNAEVQKDSVRVISDHITVVAATQTTTPVAAKVWLLPATPQSVFDDLPNLLRAAHAAESGLGFDLKVSWLQARLMQQGIAKVEITTPAADVVVDDNFMVAIGTITLTDMGRDR